LNNTARGRRARDTHWGESARRVQKKPRSGARKGLVTRAPANYDRAILPREAPRARPKPAPLPTVRLLLQDVAAGIRVLQTRDGIELTDEQILERARNIVTGLLGNYKIRSLEARAARGTEASHQMDLLDQIEARAEARNNGRPGRA
jgi:hypothetical protein